MTEQPTRLYPCPRCKKNVKYDTQNSFRPFCSTSCKEGDIIDWADGNYSVGTEPAEPEELVEEMQRRMRDDEG